TRMWIAFDSFISGAAAFALPALGLTQRRRLPERLLLAVFWFCSLFFIWTVTKKVVISHVDQREFLTPMRYFIRLAAIATFASFPLWWYRWSRLALGALVVSALSLLAARWFALLVSPEPRVDVVTLAKEAAEALWRGENPYAADYSNLYEGTKLDLGYSPGYN